MCNLEVKWVKIWYENEATVNKGKKPFSSIFYAFSWRNSVGSHYSSHIFFGHGYVTVIVSDSASVDKVLAILKRGNILSMQVAFYPIFSRFRFLCLNVLAEPYQSSFTQLIKNEWVIIACCLILDTITVMLRWNGTPIKHGWSSFHLKPSYLIIFRERTEISHVLHRQNEVCE